MGEILIIGILLSIVFYEITDISPGGIIVPGIMVLYIQQADRMLYTLAISIITYLIIELFSRYFIVYGKRKFALMVIVSLIVNVCLAFMLKILTIQMITASAIGYTISGLIAYEMSKQGVFKTISGMTIVIGILQMLIIIFTSIGIIL